jgi:hypothetical protein
MKKTALFLTTYVFLTLLAVSPIWDRVYKSYSTQKYTGTYSQLLVKSLRGDYEIYVDNVLKGEVKSKESKELAQIQPGDRLLKLVRKSDINGFFYTLEKIINFMPSSQVEVEWESGPNLESSSGVIKYFKEIIKPDGVQVYILPFPVNASILLDEKKVSGNTFDIYDTLDHSVKISNGDGFENKIISFNLSNQMTMKTLTNLRLNIEVYLYKQPF